MLSKILDRLKEFNGHKINDEFVITEWMLDKYFFFNTSEIKYIKENCIQINDDNVSYIIKLKGETK